MTTNHPNSLHVRRMGVDTQSELVAFMRKDSGVCRAEGFTAHTRIRVSNGQKSIIVTLYQVDVELLDEAEIGLSDSAWRQLSLKEGDSVTVAHSEHVDSLSLVRHKVFGNQLDQSAFDAIIGDIVAGRYSDIHLSSFITACTAGGLDQSEITALTNAMINTGQRLDWGEQTVADKHCVGGLSGNRTTPIIVAIAATCGLTIPKTSSRAITSPSGTADTMETLAPVDLDVPAMRRVVEGEGGCIVWGGAMALSPSDDLLIRVERALEIDSKGQLVASVLSKKVAAGSTHVVLDLPVGPAAKIRSDEAAKSLADSLRATASALDLAVTVVCTDGSHPVGHGIGPALEARDVIAVLNNAPNAPTDLRDRALLLTGTLLEAVGCAQKDQGIAMAAETLKSGNAWAKFQAICTAQGGMREPPHSSFSHPVLAKQSGRLANIDNRHLAKVAKLAGAPDAKAAGVELHAKVGDRVDAKQPLYTVHAETRGELDYSLAYAKATPDIVALADT